MLAKILDSCLCHMLCAKGRLFNSPWDAEGFFAYRLLDKVTGTLWIVRDSGTKQKAHQSHCTDGSSAAASWVACDSQFNKSTSSQKKGTRLKHKQQKIMKTGRSVAWLQDSQGYDRNTGLFLIQTESKNGSGYGGPLLLWEIWDSSIMWCFSS